VEDRDLVITHCPFLGKMKHRGGKEDADDDADNVGKKRYNEASPLGMVLNSKFEVVIHRYPIRRPDSGKKYPRPQQHDKDASKQAYDIDS